MKLSLQKPIVTNINAMNATSVSDLRDKARALRNALGGGGGVGGTPGAIAFCKELLAKRLVVSC